MLGGSGSERGKGKGGEFGAVLLAAGVVDGEAFAAGAAVGVKVVEGLEGAALREQTGETRSDRKWETVRILTGKGGLYDDHTC